MPFDLFKNLFTLGRQGGNNSIFEADRLSTSTDQQRRSGYFNSKNCYYSSSSYSSSYSSSSNDHIRQQILCQNFSDANDNARLVSMSRFFPADHNDCILATEIISINNHYSPSLSDISSFYNHLKQPSPSVSIRQQRQLQLQTALSSSQTQQSQPQQTKSFFLINYMRNVIVYMSSTLPRRKFLSAITLLILVSIFCLISSSIVDILISSPSSSSPSSREHDNKYSSSNKANEALNSIDNNLKLASYLQPILLEEIYRNELSANYFNGSWVNDKEIAFYDAEYNFCLYSVDTQVTNRFISFIFVLTKNLKGFKLSKDKHYLLWPTEEPREIFRYSQLEKLKIYDIANNTILGLFDSDRFHDSHFQFAEWGPKDSQLVFIYENNIYYKHTARSETVRLTVTGIPGVIFNGHCDWLYEEEILNSNQALWFSPNGEHLAYLQINDSLVDAVPWNHYGEYINVSTNQYPHMKSIRYPKPGRHNPQVTVFVANLHANTELIRLMKIEPPRSIFPQEKDFYVSRVVWYDDKRLLIVWTYRHQRRLLLTICDADHFWKCQELYDLRSETGWVDGLEDGLLSASNVDRVIIRLPKFVSEIKGDFYHIATINVKDKSIDYLTHGDFDIIKLIHYSPITNEVFYASTLSNHPEVQHIMKISLNVKTDQVCLTCYLGNSCRHNEAYFNPSGTYYVLECKGYEIPRTELRSALTNDLIETLEENRRLFQFLQTKFIPRYEKIFVKLADNYDAIVEFILPHDFDEDRRYPMVIELYGAPGTQMIRDKYEMNHWSSYLTSKHEYIYAKIDCRGTVNQGLKHMHQLYKNVGRIEVEDLINVVWFLKHNLTYVDPNRIALWGWSYGGYFSLMALIRQFNHRLFACAIAVAPVSNWMYYDSAYSEKHLGVPRDQQSLRPYQESNLLDVASGLRNKKFLIIFGTGDDNVHDQHSLMLIRQLNQLNIDYDVQIYPDDNHYLSKSSTHLYPKMTDYLRNKCFQLH